VADIKLRRSQRSRVGGVGLIQENREFAEHGAAIFIIFAYGGEHADRADCEAHYAMLT
jgi:hypothetical protein